MIHKKEKKKNERWREDNKQFDVSGVQVGTLSLFSMVRIAVFHYGWVQRRFWLCVEKEKMRQENSHILGVDVDLKRRNKRIIRFDVKYKTNFFASFDGRMSANSSLIGCCNLCGSEGEGRRKASWPASPDWTEDRVKGSYGLDAKDFVIAFHHRIPTGKVGEFPSWIGRPPKSDEYLRKWILQRFSF